ncbi:hypothetical protein DFH08DRAFT_797633 [Mycena albidolilacea]|uniref:Uncharacterized protein n=1 Tax=Mycena albidolilacea TaxID=1033008 RepID=A0AAD7F2U1_9AGAR|nr:hypothetical protein DFH08DRAFT_797633 [Mycena albidolilacea]
MRSYNLRRYRVDFVFLSDDCDGKTRHSVVGSSWCSELKPELVYSIIYRQRGTNKPEHDWAESADGGNEDTGANHSEPDGNGDEVGPHNPGKGAEEEEDSNRSKSCNRRNVKPHPEQGDLREPPLGHIDPAGYRSGFFAVARHLQKVWGVEGDLQMPPEEQDEYGEYSRSHWSDDDGTDDDDDEYDGIAELIRLASLDPARPNSPFWKVVKSLQQKEQDSARA